MLMEAYWLVFPLIGILAGLMAGLFGVGGGLIIVPLLITVFQLLHFSEAVLTHMAVGTSLACIIATALASIWAHHGMKSVLWGWVQWLAIGLVAGALLGAAIADALQGAVLQMLFGGFAMVMAYRLLARKAAAPGSTAAAYKPTPAWLKLLVGAGIGTVSAIFGIGGGSLTVPWLVSRQVPMKEAVGTSAACGLPISVAGAIGFALAGADESQLPVGAVGYVYLPAFVGIVATSTFSARFGALLAHRLSPVLLQRLFAVLLITVGIQLIVMAILK